MEIFILFSLDSGLLDPLFGAAVCENEELSQVQSVLDVIYKQPGVTLSCLLKPVLDI